MRYADFSPDQKQSFDQLVSLLAQNHWQVIKEESQDENQAGLYPELQASFEGKTVAGDGQTTLSLSYYIEDQVLVLTVGKNHQDFLGLRFKFYFHNLASISQKIVALQNEMYLGNVFVYIAQDFIPLCTKITVQNPSSGSQIPDLVLNLVD